MITKKLILEKVSEEDLIKNLVPAFNSNIKKKNYKSIFSEKDDNPSMSIYQDPLTGRYKFKSFNTGHQGDVFQMYADLWGLNPKTQFNELLKRINDELNLNLDINNIDGYYETKEFEIEYYLTYTDLFLKYWKQFGVDEAILRKYNILQTKKFILNRPEQQFKFLYEERGIINVCYRIEDRIKLYTPKIPSGFGGNFGFREQQKKFCYKNQKSQDVFGLAQLPNTKLDYILITAGEKDCLVASAHGFDAISLQSENQLPQETLLKQLKRQTKCIIACYDNDKAGSKAAATLNDRFGISSIQLPKEVNDIADFFKKFDSDYFNKLLTEAKRYQRVTVLKQDTTGVETIFHLAEAYLLNKYNFRYNIIKQKHEISLRSENKYEPLNIKGLYVELKKHGIKISLNDTDALIHSDFCPEYNPIKHYFESLRKWGKTEEDYIAKLANHVKTDRPKEWITSLKKWLVRSIKCVFHEGYFNKHALILVQTKQNTGKTFFCRFLCPPALKNYMTEFIDIYDKDSRIALGTNFIINLDELKEFSNKNMSSLKSMLSSSEINVRLPYAKRTTVVKRICSFIGSTNNSQFLSDETGNVRWLCFSVKEIDFSYHNTRTGKSTIDIDDVYAQALALYKSGFDCELTKNEIDEIEGGNEKYKHVSPESEYLLEYFEPAAVGEGEFFNSTKIADFIQERTKLKIKPVTVGKALSAAGFPKSHHAKLYGYWVHIK